MSSHPNNIRHDFASFTALWIFQLLEHSVLSDKGDPSEALEVLQLLEDLQQQQLFKVTDIPFAQCLGWQAVNGFEKICHQSGAFFSVQGAHIDSPAMTPDTWDQPILVQPEIGILGILGKFIDTEIRFLVQFKPEPGLNNQVQIGPTVQATFSNYTRVHGGKGQPFLDYFLEPRSISTVVVDELLSEQGGRFWQKRNRNMVVITLDDIEAPKGYHWLTFSQLILLLKHDQLLNFDLRNVLSRLILASIHQSVQLSRILTPSQSHSIDWLRVAQGTDKVMSQLEDLQTQLGFSSYLIPLIECADWVCDPLKIVNKAGNFFEIIAARVVTGVREIGEWDQPFLRPVAPGLIRVVSVTSDNGECWLVRARREAGNSRMMLTPTLQTHNRSLFLASIPDQVDSYCNRVLFTSEQSEEGGRFQGENIRYEVMQCNSPGSSLGKDWFCLTLSELLLLELHFQCLNSHLRHLLTLYLAHHLRFHIDEC